MMELYQDKLRQFLRLFPPTLLSSNYKDGGYIENSSYYGLQQNFIQYNSKDRINIIAVDIDHHKDGAAWLDHDLPQPTWTVFTLRGVQFSWVLRNPILTRDPYAKQNLKYLKDTLNKIVYALGADTNAMGFNRVFRNPLMHDTHYSDTRVDLKDFGHLETPSQKWWAKLKGETKRDHGTDTLFENISTPREIVEFSGMKEGDGRNLAMFDRLRFYAYDTARQGEYNEFDLAHRGLAINQEFAEPLSDRELNRIIGSIDNYIESKYNHGGYYMVNTTKEERTEAARKNGKKGGAVTAKVKQSEASARIRATITQMQSFDIKITIGQVARMAKSTRPTVRAYFKKHGWSEASRKEGWKRKTISLTPPTETLSNQLF